MKNIFLVLSLVSILSTSCQKEEMDLPSTLPELSGSYTYYKYESWEGGLYERSRYMSYDFDNTRRTWHYSNYWSYTSSGWINALKEPFSAYYEWKVEDGKFKERLWDNEYSDWQSYDFELIDNNTFILDGYTYEKD